MKVGAALKASWECRNDAGGGWPSRATGKGFMTTFPWSPAGGWGSDALISSCPQSWFPASLGNEFGARAIFETT